MAPKEQDLQHYLHTRRHEQFYSTIKPLIGIILAFVVLIVIGSILSPVLLTHQNILNVLRQASIIGVMSIGMTFVIISGGIDLSVAANMTLASVIAASFLNSHGNFAAIGVALLVGLIVGLINGLVINKFNVPFIVTLGMMSVCHGLALTYTDARIIVAYSSFFNFLGRGFIGPLPVPVVIFLAVFILALIFEKRTVWSRYIYALGGNEEAARLSAIKTSYYKVLVYCLTGLLCGVAGIIMLARLGSGDPTVGKGLELDAIAAVVIGGTSLFGGVGTVIGTLIGVLIMQTMNNLLNLLNVSSYAQHMVKGLIIVGAIMIHMGGKQTTLNYVKNVFRIGRGKSKSV